MVGVITDESKDAFASTRITARLLIYCLLTFPFQLKKLSYYNEDNVIMVKIVHVNVQMCLLWYTFNSFFEQQYKWNNKIYVKIIIINQNLMNLIKKS